ncbi:hypothetical protein LTR94_033109, partial [Friedmanniomyces endolithicus]
MSNGPSQARGTFGNAPSGALRKYSSAGVIVCSRARRAPTSIPPHVRGGIDARQRVDLRAGPRTTGPIGRPAGRRPALARGVLLTVRRTCPQMNCSRNVLYVDQRPVAATEPPAAWLGGKRHLAKRICHVLASTPHDAYVEPFIGMGG